MFIVLVMKALENFQEHKRKYCLLPFLVFKVIFACIYSKECYFKSRLSLIVRVNVVLNRTVVVDSD